MKIGNLAVCESDAPVRVVAEMSNAHNGSLERARRIIDAVKESGADFLKTQAFVPSELVALRGDGPAPDPWGSQGWSIRTLYEKAQTPHAWFPELVKHCNDIGLPWFSSVFGAKSLQLLEYLDCPAYKVAALDNSSELLFEKIGLTGKPVIFSERPISGLGCRWTNGKKSLRLLCPEGYPQPEALLSRLRNWFDGFSYHGTDPSVPAYAVAAGARILEVHVQLDDEPSELEENVSLTISQLKWLVVEVRRVEAML